MFFINIFLFVVGIQYANGQILHHHPDHLHNPVHAEIITKHFGETDVEFEHNVIILTKDNFYYMVGAHEILLALFHVSWDPKYNEVLEEFEKAAGILQREHPSICMGRLDVSEHPEIAKKMDIRGEEPQFMFFYKNRAYNFEHSYKAEHIAKELVKRQEAIWYPPQNLPEQMAEMREEDIDRTMASKNFAVLFMYSPTRLSSVRLLMELENAAAKMNLSNTFFKINVAESKELRNKYGIPPVITIYRKGKAFDYKGPKVAKGIVNHLRGQMQPPFIRLLTTEEWDTFLRKHQDKPTVMGYFDNEKLPQFQLFTEAADVLRGQFYFVVLRQFVPTIGWTEKEEDEKWRVGVILPKHDSDPDIVKEKDVSRSKENLKTLEELLRFIEVKSIPVVGHRTKKNKDNTIHVRRPLVVGYMNVDWSTESAAKETKFVRHKIAQIAVEHPASEYVFAISNAKDFKDELERFGFDIKDDRELWLGIFGKDGERYPLRSEERLSSAIINEFLKEFKAGKVLPYYRSEKPILDTENKDPVKIVAGATFTDAVLKSEKEVLISFCHPLCKICKTVEENMMAIASPREFPSVEFLAMDTSLNDAPAYYPIKTYPTLYFASPKNASMPVKYTGKDYSTKELYRFLDKHVSLPRSLTKNEL